MSGLSHTVSPQPPVSTQRTVDGKTRFTCWADAWISWVAARPQKPWWLPPLDRNKPETLLAGKMAVLDQYQEWVNPNGSFQSGGEVGRFGIGLLFAAANMDVQLFKDGAKAPAKPVKSLTSNFLYSKLKKGHVYAFFVGNRFAPDQTGHAVVIYGINANSKSAQIKVMDPWPNTGHVTRDLAYFTASKQVVLGWPE